MSKRMWLGLVVYLTANVVMAGPGFRGLSAIMNGTWLLAAVLGDVAQRRQLAFSHYVANRLVQLELHATKRDAAPTAFTN